MPRISEYLMLIAFVSGCGWRSPDSAGVLRYNPGVIWTDAEKHCEPSYPDSASTAGHAGLVVLRVQFAPDGAVKASTVLQAPDPEIGNSARACVSNWKMMPLKKGVPAARAREGLLYFYYVLAHDSPRVYIANDPAQRSALIALRSRRGVSR